MKKTGSLKLLFEMLNLSSIRPVLWWDLHQNGPGRPVEYNPEWDLRALMLRSWSRFQRARYISETLLCAKPVFIKKVKKLPELLLVVDPEKCNGCSTCEAQCSIKHEGQCNPSRSRIRVAKWEFEGIFIPVVCQQCEKPVCKEVCPVSAIYEDPILGVMINSKACIGCRLCTFVCPYGAIDVDDEKGVAYMCDLCGGDPICVKFCPNDAIKYLRRDRISMERKRSSTRKISELLGRAVAGQVEILQNGSIRK